jgi:CheY-like chemotaxis protein
MALKALAQLKAGHRPGVILLDLMMPIMDGWTFCEETAKDPALAAIPILLLSAVARDTRNACLRAAERFSKPVNLGMLLSAVARYC